MIFLEKDFLQIFSDIHGFGIVFLDWIRERQWHGLVYCNTDLDAYYCPNFIYLGIDVATIDHDQFCYPSRSRGPYGHPGYY